METRSKENFINEIYNNCMVGNRHKISASMIAICLKSPFSIYCDYHVDAEYRDPMVDPFMEKLSEKGKQHEKAVNIKLYPNAKRISTNTIEEEFKTALKLMKKRTDTLIEFTLFYKPEGFVGRLDNMIIQDGKSIFGDHYYTTNEIKSSKTIRQYHIMQAAFYAYMIGLIQQRMPDKFFITDGNMVKTEYLLSNYIDELKTLINMTRSIIDGNYRPTPTYNSCNYPWSNYCNKMVIQAGDLSLLSGVGESRKTQLNKAGFHTISDILNKKEKLSNIESMGEKRMNNLVTSATALIKNISIKKSEFDLPENKNKIFLDLEGYGAVKQFDYMIGLIYNNTYHVFTAESGDEKRMLDEFLLFMKQFDNYMIYHYGHYDKTRLKQMLERHNIINNLTENMVDLYKIATNAYAFPTPSNSIKEIAGWMGFKWQHTDVTGTNSLELYEQYLEGNKECMQYIKDYNKDDCKALIIVNDWLKSQS